MADYRVTVNVLIDIRVEARSSAAAKKKAMDAIEEYGPRLMGGYVGGIGSPRMFLLADSVSDVKAEEARRG